MVLILTFFWRDILMRLSRVAEMYWGFPHGSVGKESTCNAGNTGDLDLIPGSGRSPGGGHDNPPHYSCLKNLMDRGSWRAAVHRVTRVGHNWSNLAQTHMHAPWKKSYDKSCQGVKKQRHHFPNKVYKVKAMVFPTVMYGCESWIRKKAECCGAREDSWESLGLQGDQTSQY